MEVPFQHAMNDRPVRSFFGTPLLTLLLCSSIGMTGNAVAQIYGYHRIIASEPGPDGNLHNTGGLNPYGELIQTSDGKLYGTAFEGGANGSGTIFYVSDGSNAGLGARPVPAYTFSATHGATPSDPQTNSDGAIPSGLTLGADGLFYGVTQIGGVTGYGTIFKMTSAGLLTTIYTFSVPSAAGTNADGAVPIGKLLQMLDGSFYGVARAGGANGTGTVYRIGADGSFSTVYNFASVDASTHSNSSGGGPLAGLALGVDGNLYGVTEYGGTMGGGIVFRLTTAGELTLLHDFVPGAPTWDGFRPNAALLRASDGNFYGTTFGGGAGGGGIVFKLGPDGTFAIVHQFGSVYGTPPVVDGMSPAAPLIELSDGTLVGTTTSGYGPAAGTVFAISKSGDYRTVFEFIDTNTNGVAPSGGLTLGSNGILYGLTSGITAQNPELGIAGTAYAMQLTSSVTATVSVSPDTVPLGQTFTVSWNAPGATSCQFGQDSTTQPGSGSFTTGGSTIGAAGPVVYQLDCATPNGNTTASVVETVYLPAPTVKISLTTSSITVGESISLTWSSTNADTCQASGDWSGQQDTEGTSSESPASPGKYTYTITCTNTKGTASASASLTASAKAVSNTSSSGGGAFDGKFLFFLLTLRIWRRRSFP